MSAPEAPSNQKPNRWTFPNGARTSAADEEETQLAGIAGVLPSLGAAMIAADVAALAFGFEATQKGYGAVALAVFTGVGVVCGGLAVQGSFRGRPVILLIAGSAISAVMAALACLVMAL